MEGDISCIIMIVGQSMSDGDWFGLMRYQVNTDAYLINSQACIHVVGSPAVIEKSRHIR